MVDFKAIEQKWKKRWKESKVFEADSNHGKKKFFGTFPYPYMNGYLHIGHFYSLMRLEVFSRYKRMKGYNVLFPQGWHCTGSPIESAAKRIREKEPKQIESMKKQGFSNEEIKKFSEPKYWTEFFPKAAKEDYENLGMSVDFRRSFITTELNPYYNKFIEWQFHRLKEKNYVIKGKHPVVWDPNENCPVGDHDRIEGEGETPQEFLLVKHKLDKNKFLISATLRQDTILGITNLYVDPDAEYAEIETGNEKWIVGKNCLQNLEAQGFRPKVLGNVPGKSLIGKKVEVVGGRKVLILPATFLDPNFGTGLVHSVPSDSADDLIALLDFQKDEKTIKKYGLDIKEVKAIKPITVLNTPGFRGCPAEVLLKKENVKSQDERKKLDKIRAEMYKVSFYSATFNELYKDFFSKDLSGKPVQEWKDFLKKELIAMGFVKVYYQLTGKVIARSLSVCVVKVVDDQWFLNYSNKEWKKQAHKALQKMKLYPEKSRQQFDYVIDWLQDWACTREFGLGTKLPWDKKWVIESLSDSTIYMAYYTIAHLIEKEDIKNIDDSFFDYIFLNKGKPKGKIKNLEAMKKEFEYWYPMDFRNSGKDLIQNHLAFSIFNHAAIFPENKWPKSFGVNGWVLVDGQKMSKSLGNFIILKELEKMYPVDASRITIMSGGEDLDDPNWDSEFAKSMPAKLEQLYNFCLEFYNKGTNNVTNADKWMESQLNLIIKDATAFMEETLFRSALQKAFFELGRVTRNYISKTNNNPNKKIIDKAIEAQILLLAPFAPFIAEELWEKIGRKGFVSKEKWPEFDEDKIDLKAIVMDKISDETRKDIHAVIGLSKKEKISKITLFIAEVWKYELFKMLKDEMSKTRNQSDIIKKIMSTELKKHGNDAMKIVPRVLKDMSLLPEVVISKEDEIKSIKESLTAYKKEFNCDVVLEDSEKSGEMKARQSLPGKVAILIE